MHGFITAIIYCCIKQQVSDVGSSHPGAVGGPKGGGVHPLKRRVSWVQTVVRQVGPYPVGVSEG